MLSTNNNILFNGNTTTTSKNWKKSLMELAKLKQVNLTNLANFLEEDYRNFSVLTANLKIILSTQRTSVTLSKNSAKSFYLAKEPLSQKSTTEKPKLKDDCLTDAQNCQYFQFFSSKEKKLYTRFNDKCEANFEGNEAKQPLLFLTLTFNTTQDNLYTWTTNWNSQDDCWNTLQSKKTYDLKHWAQKKFADSSAHPLKVPIQKIAKEDATNLAKANLYVAKFLRNVRSKWKPNNWKWTIVAELQKRGVWHFHLLSTPIVPYSHKCTLSKNFTACWNCRTYLSELWPWGRVESRSPGKKTISKYLAKYISKSFHLRSLYAKHGLKENHKVYRFFKNLYEYDEYSVIIQNGKRYDALTNQLISNHQKVFRKADNTYYYRTNERLTNRVKKPFTLKKNYRLGTDLSVKSLLKLAKKHKENLLLSPKKSRKSLITKDFQEFLITRLLLFCKKAHFSHLPLEQNKVPKISGNCDKSANSHFQFKPVLHFEFSPENSQLIKNFFTNLDTYAEQYDMEEAKDFYFYPTPETSKENARNAFLNRWYDNYCQDYIKQPLYERKGGAIM